MSVSTDYMRLNIESFGRVVMKHHNVLNPIITNRDNLEVFSERPDFRRALTSLLAELKSQKLKLGWFEKQI